MKPYLKVTAVIFLSLIFCGYSVIALAAKKEEAAPSAGQAGSAEQLVPATPAAVIATKNIQGEVTWVGKGRIAIVFSGNDENKSEEEILLPVAGDVSFEHKKSLQDISVGDTVSIAYQEVTEPGAETKKSRKAKVITFIKASSKKEKSAVLGAE